MTQIIPIWYNYRDYFLYTSMALPQNNNPDATRENWELKAQEIRWEENERLSKIEADFRESPEYKKLSSIVEDKKILETIVTNYADTNGNLEAAIRKTFTDPTSAKRLWLVFSSNEKAKKTVNQLIEEIASYIPKDEEWKQEEQEPPTEEDEGTSMMAENISENEEIHVEEKPGFPVLQKLERNNIISPQHFESIQNELTNGNSLKDAIISSVENPDDRKHILSFFNEENPEKKAEIFFKNMPDEIAKNKDNSIVQLIAENYTEIPGKNGEKPSKEADFKTAIQEAANTTINGKEVSRNEGFERAMKTIQRGNDKEDMFIALWEVYSYVNRHEGARGRNDKQKQRLAQKAKAQKINEQEVTFQELIEQAKKNADTQQQARIEKVMAAQNAEKKDKVSNTWEGWMGGDVLDILSEIQTDSPKKAA